MYFRAVILTSFFFIASTAKGEVKNETSLVSVLQDKFEISKYARSLTDWLVNFNDEHLGNSEIGRFIHYNEIKPKIEETGRQARNMKKMGLALIPLIFHVGVSTTWMLVTMFLAAKSVAIGMLLLIFKIAVSSAKVASFFTLLKSKHHHVEWTPHYEHHHDSQPTYLDHPPADWSASSSYNPSWGSDSSPPVITHPGPVYKEVNPYGNYAYDKKSQ